FVSPSDGQDIGDAYGHAIHTEAPPGLDRAKARFRNFDADEIAWQIEVIRENTSTLSRGAKTEAAKTAAVPPQQAPSLAPTTAIFSAEADRIAATLSRYAIRRGPSAAWIGLDWLGDAEVSQLVVLGPDLYNGVCGLGVFLAAHAAVTGNEASA